MVGCSDLGLELVCPSLNHQVKKVKLAQVQWVQENGEAVLYYCSL